MKKILLTTSVVILLAVLFSGCIIPSGLLSTEGWEPLNDEGTAAKLKGRLFLSNQDSLNWTGFVYDTEYHDSPEEYQYKIDGVLTTEKYIINFEADLYDLDPDTTYHFRAIAGYWMHNPNDGNIYYNTRCAQDLSFKLGEDN